MSRDIITLYSIAEFCEAIGSFAPKVDYFDCRRFEDINHSLQESLPPYRQTFYQVALISEGQTDVQINHSSFQIKANSLFLSGPGDVVSYDIREELKGYSLVFNDGFMALSIQLRERWEALSLFEEGGGTVLPLTPTQVSNKEFVFRQILEEQSSVSTRNFDVIRSYIIILLINASRIAEEQGRQTTPTDKAHELAVKYKRLISCHLRELSKGDKLRLWLVGEFAEALNVHANYLNEAVKKHHGISASQLLQQKVTLEALTLLRQTELSVAHVALRLGFENSAHFSNFFKKNTNLSPSSYRALLKL